MMKNDRIMIVANDTSYVYKLRKEILKSFVEKGYTVYIVAKKINFVKELESIGCNVIDLNIPRHGTNPFSDLKLYSQAKVILNQTQPDIVFSYNIKPNVYFGLACDKYKIPFVPNITGLGKALEYPGLLQILAKKLYKIGLKGASTVLFQNSYNRDFFFKNNIITEDQDYFILPGSGVNTEEYGIMDYPSTDKIYFLFIGRIRKEKGIEYLINSAKKLHMKYSNVFFNICGLCEDDKYIQIFDELEQDGYLKYNGEQKDLTPFYKSANCIVHPTYYPEGMSNVLLEACSHARPIITTDRPGCREIVDDGYNGYMIETRNQEQLDSALEKFINLSYDDKLKMGLNGREKIEKQFDRKLVVNKYMELTADILDN